MQVLGKLSASTVLRLRAVNSKRPGSSLKTVQGCGVVCKEKKPKSMESRSGVLALSSKTQKSPGRPAFQLKKASHRQL